MCVWYVCSYVNVFFYFIIILIGVTKLKQCFNGYDLPTDIIMDRVNIVVIWSNLSLDWIIKHLYS